MAIKVMIAFSNMLFSEGVKRLLDGEDDIVVAHLMPVGNDPYEKIKSLKPDVILVDFTSLYNDFVNREGSEKFILFDTCCGEENIISSVLSKGVKGIIMGDTSLPLLKKAIKMVNGGEVWMDKGTVKNLISGVNALKDSNLPALSVREKEIVILIKRGFTNREVAQQLFISEPTVKSHLYNIFRKLNIQNRPQLIAFAYQNSNILESPALKS